MKIFNEKTIEKAIQSNSCDHEPTYCTTDGVYTLTAHVHDDGVMVINSFKKKDIKSVDEQIKEVRLKYNI